MKRLSKLFLSIFVLCLWLMGAYSHADATWMTITLTPWWNVVSTPYILSSLSFSNGWNWISFSKLQNWKRIDVPANITNIKPLEWYMAYNNNSENVTLTFSPKNNVSPIEAVLQKNLNFWWDLLWITTINSPFNNIPWATMSLDFTRNWTNNLKNKVNSNYTWDTTSSSISNPELWEAYWIFINQQNAVYWGVNGWWSNESDGWDEWDNDKINWDLTIRMVPLTDEDPKIIPIWYDSIAWEITITPTQATEDWLEVNTITLILNDLYTATPQDIESIWLWDNKEYDGLDWIKTDIQPIWEDWIVTLTFNENVNFSRQSNPFYIWVKTKSTAIEWASLDILVKWIDTNIKNIINNASEKRSWVSGRGFYTVLQNLSCDNQWFIESKCESDYELYCPSRYIQKCNYVRPEDRISEFNNTLGDVTLFVSNGDWYDEDELDWNVFYWNTVRNILIASWNINTDTSKTLTFSIETNEKNASSMTLLVWNRGYQWLRSNSWNNHVYTFTDVLINDGEDFIIYFSLWSDNLINLTIWKLYFTVVNDQIPWFNLRKIDVKTSLFEHKQTISPDFVNVNKNEKYSEIIYNGVYDFYDDLTIDKIHLHHSLIWGWMESYHNRRYFHIYFNDTEVFNSSMAESDWYGLLAPFEIERYRVNSGEKLNIKVIIDVLLPDSILSESLYNNLEFYWIADNWIRYQKSISMARLYYKSNNTNNLQKSTYSATSCVLDWYQYPNCDNDKLVVFSWTYSSSNNIELKSFKINHLAWPNLDNLNYNFYLYINDSLVWEYDMRDLTESQTLPSISISSTETKVKLLAEPIIHNDWYRFLWSLTFEREKPNWTTWKDSITTETLSCTDVNVDVSYSTRNRPSKDRVLLRMRGYVIGSFLATPTNNSNQGVKTVKFKLSWTADINPNHVETYNWWKVNFDWEYYTYEWSCSQEDWCAFIIDDDKRLTGTVIFSDLIVNGIPRDNIKHTTLYVWEGLAVLSFERQNHNDYNTTFIPAKTLWWNVTISNLKIYANWNDTPIYQEAWEVNSVVSVDSKNIDQIIDKISYDVVSNSTIETIVIEKSVVPDFFKDKFGDERIVTKNPLSH